MGWIGDNFGWFVLVFMVGFIGVLIYACRASNQEEDKLITACIADGHKEYECVSMLRNNHQITPIPIIIPNPSH